MVIVNAKDYICICGRRAKYLNIKFDRKYGTALCEKCRDMEVKKLELKKSDDFLNPRSDELRLKKEVEER